MMLPLFAQAGGAPDFQAILAQLMPYLYALIAVGVALTVLSIIVSWVIFAKAGQPGWASLIPIYNLYVLLVPICGFSVVWFILALIPCTAPIAALYLMFAIPGAMAKRFGQGFGFAVGLFFLGIIFYPLLAFGDYKYNPPALSTREG